MSALDAVAYCHLGSSRAPYPESGGFDEALRLGLLAHDPVWRATERGVGALIAAGLVKGDPAPERVSLHVVWARHAEGDPSAGWPQFVAAFPDGLVDAWPELYERERAKAQAEYTDFLGEYGAVAEFFVTVIDVARPDLAAAARLEGDTE